MKSTIFHDFGVHGQTCMTVSLEPSLYRHETCIVGTAKIAASKNVFKNDNITIAIGAVSPRSKRFHDSVCIVSFV